MNAPDDPVLAPRVSRAWLLTFSDLVALILTFFVMLYAMHRVDTARYRDVVDSLSRSLAPAPEATDDRPNASLSALGVRPLRAAGLPYLAALFAEKAREDKSLAALSVTLGENRLVIGLPADLLFAPGSASLGEKAYGALYTLGGVLSTIGNALSVEGNTDPAPITTGIYHSNRALSLARALAVADALHELGYARDIPAKGLGDSRFAALDKVEPEAKRYALGRRVDVVIGPYRSAP